MFFVPRLESSPEENPAPCVLKENSNRLIATVPLISESRRFIFPLLTERWNSIFNNHVFHEPAFARKNEN